MLVVSNTSPLSNLAIIDRLDLLRTRYGRIEIPQRVKLELGALSHPEGNRRILQALADGWLLVRSLTDTALSLQFEIRVDPGEAEAIALAEELSADKLLIDDKLGRELARERHIPISGLLGELLYAKFNGRIPNVSSVLDQLQFEARFFVRNDLRELILRQAGE